MKLKHHNLQETTISMEEAIERTKTWRELYMQMFSEPPENVFKGFRIPLEDIQELAQQYTEDKIAYVRAYLSAQPIVGSAAPYELSILLVPVDENDKDILTHKVQGKTQSAIYDFTQPCPPCCDISSPLFNGIPTGPEQQEK